MTRTLIPLDEIDNEDLPCAPHGWSEIRAEAKRVREALKRNQSSYLVERRYILRLILQDGV